MYKACSRCGRMHPTSYICNVNKGKRKYVGGEERKLRSSNKWTEKSKEIRERANFLCEVCKDHGVYNYRDLEVHHIIKLTRDTGGLLDNSNLICLCVEHHKEADRGSLSIDYLRELAQKRESST